MSWHAEGVTSGLGRPGCSLGPRAGASPPEYFIFSAFPEGKHVTAPLFELQWTRRSFTEVSRLWTEPVCFCLSRYELLKELNVTFFTVFLMGSAAW